MADQNAPPIHLPIVTAERLCTEQWRRFFRTASAVIDLVTTTLATLGTTVAALPVLASGVYTPVLTNSVNLSASTATPCQWSRVGTVVTVSGRVDADAVALADTQLGLSVPVASAFTQVYQCGGTGADELGGCVVAIGGDVANARALLRWIPVTLVNRGYAFSFTYQVL